MGAEPPSLCCILFGGKKGLAEKARRLVDSYRLELKDITIQERIGEGASSVVYQGLYKGAKVAVKQLKSCGKGSDSERAFRREVLSLMSCVHKNVLKLYGVLVVASPKGEELWIVTKFMEGGSLQKYLMQRNHLKLREILRIAEDIARGMEFLHSKGIMHMYVYLCPCLCMCVCVCMYGCFRSRGIM
jgi:serine/threonine protein kinase